MRSNGPGLDPAVTASVERVRPAGYAWCLGAGVALPLLVSVLGTSVSVPPLRSGTATPPWSLGLHPSPYLATGLLALGLVLGGVGVWGNLQAIKRGWRPPVRRLIAVGAIAALGFVLVPPLGSADYTNYSAYGHIANRGLDAYRVVPTAAARRGVPTAGQVQPPWRSTPSVYGPSAVVAFRVAAWLGGTSLHGTAFWLSGIQAVAFLATGALVLSMARDKRRRARAAVLWFANPVLLLEVVGGAHIDGIVMLAAIAGLAVYRRSRLGAGALVGLSIAAKLTAGIVGLGMALVDRRSPRRLAALAVGAVAVAGGIYLTASPYALDQTRKASAFVSPSTPWWWVRGLLKPLLSTSVLHAVTDGGSLLLAALVAVAAFRVLPITDPGDDRQLAARAALCCSIGYLFGTAYVLPWYDSLAWALIPLVAASLLDELLLLHTTILGLGMLPGRKMTLPEPLRVVTVGAHAWLAPAVGLATLVVLGLRARRPAPSVAMSDHSGVHRTASLGRSA